MARPDRDIQFRDSLERILEYPEVAERFARMEAMTVDEIVSTSDEEQLLELCRYLKTLRNFRKGVASYSSMRRRAEAKREADG